MRLRWVVALMFTVALISVGAVLSIQRLGRVPDADPGGLPVVCSPHGKRCWQGGEEVAPIFDGKDCAMAAEWRSLDATDDAFVCRVLG